MTEKRCLGYGCQFSRTCYHYAKPGDAPVFMPAETGGSCDHYRNRNAGDDDLWTLMMGEKISDNDYLD